MQKKMKKFVSLLAVAAMTVSMAVSAMSYQELDYVKAEDMPVNAVYEGTLDSYVFIEDNVNVKYYYDSHAFLEKTGDQAVLTFTFENGKTAKISGHIDDILGNNLISGSWSTKVYLEDEEYSGEIFWNPTFTYSSDNTIGTTAEIWPDNWETMWIRFATGLELKLVDETPVSANKMFISSAVSNRGDYELALSGRINANLKTGKNVLTLDEIKAMTINVFAYNTITGEERMMTSSTVEGMEINVAKGQIVSVKIDGRVQTSGGKLDRYTTTVNF